MQKSGLLDVVQLRVTTRVNGSPVRMLLGGLGGLTNCDVHEPHLIPAFSKLLKLKTGAVIDVGANTGQTLLIFLALGDVRPYVAFEPNVAAANQVQLLADINGAAHVIVIPAALSDRSGVAPLSITSRYDLGATIIPEFYSDEAVFSRFVPIITGDRAAGVLSLDGVSLVKVDAEGAELEVLRGFTATLEKFRPFIICELIPVRGPYLARERLRRRAEVLDFLRNRDYVGYEIDDFGNLLVLNNMTIADDSSVWEYLFAPIEYGPFMAGGGGEELWDFPKNADTRKAV